MILKDKYNIETKGFRNYVINNLNFSIDEVDLEKIVNQIKSHIILGIPILTAGNGGSLLSAQHFSQDLTKACGAKSFCISENIGLLTAYSNDISYESAFVSSLERFSTPFLFIAISGSGNSRNILHATYHVKHKLEMPVISFTANANDNKCPGTLTTNTYSDLNLNIDTTNMYVAESVMSIVFHYIVDRLEV